MTAQDALAAVLRDVVGPFVRTAGFKGSGRSWRRTNAVDDVAVVNVQSSAFSSADSLSCVINIALVPKPWREWLASRRGGAETLVSHASGVYRARLHPTGTPPDVDRWWEVGGEAEAVGVGRDMVARLQDTGVPLLVDLLDRARLLAAVREGDLGIFTRARTPGFVGQVEAALLTDEGPSPSSTSSSTRSCGKRMPRRPSTRSTSAAGLANGQRVSRAGHASSARSRSRPRRRLIDDHQSSCNS